MMLANKPVTRTSASAASSSAGNQGAAAVPLKTCTLLTFAKLFQPRELSPPLSAVALQPRTQLRSPSREEGLLAEEEDYVIQTLRSAPLSLFRDSPSSSEALFPPPLRTQQETPSFTAKSEARRRKEPTVAAKCATGETTSRLSAEAEPSEDVTSLLHVLSMLNVVLQRSPAALGKSGNYGKLLRQLLEHDFTFHAVQDMEELWRRCVGQSITAAASPMMVSWPLSDVNRSAFAALALYCDVLVLLSYHSDMAAKEGTTTLQSATSSASKSTPAEGASASCSRPCVCASALSLEKLYALNQEMGAALIRSTSAATGSASPPSLLRRSVASLTAFLIRHAAQLPQKVAESALRDLEVGGSAACANMAHMALVAALPSLCRAMPFDWQCRALEVVRRATLYDADVQVAYCADGPACVVMDAVMAAFGGAVHGLLSIMSDVAWCFCTADMLVHLCHAVGAYGGTWAAYPASYVGLVNFLHRALQRYRAALSAKDGSALLRHQEEGKGVMTSVSTKQVVPAARLSGQSIESLMSNVIVGVAQGKNNNNIKGCGNTIAGLQGADNSGNGRCDAQLTEVPSFAEESDGQVDDAARDEPMAYLRRCEADARSPRNFIFYLSLLAYVTSALPPLLNSFDELPVFFSFADDSTAKTEAEADAAAATVESHNAAPSYFSLCVDLLRANLSLAVAAGHEHASSAGRQRRLLCEAAVCLLSAFMCEFPHSIQRLERQTGAHQLVQTVSYAVTTIVGAPCASFQMRRAAYALLYRYGSAVNSLGAVTAQLLSPVNLAALGSNAEYTQANLRESVQLFDHLCRSSEESGPAEMSCALVAFAELPAGALRCVVGGASVATAMVDAVFGLRETTANDNGVLFGGVTVPQLPQLVSRLGEAVDALQHAHLCGCWVVSGQSTWQSVYKAVWLLHKTVTLFRVPAALAAAAFPVPVSRGADADSSVEGSGQRPRSVMTVCLRVLCSSDLQPAHREAAELLVAALQASAEQQRAQSTFLALRSTLTNAEVERLRETLLAVQKASGSLGSVSNALRLEVWLSMVRWCPALFVFLFGPEKQDDDDEGEDVGSDAAKGASASDSDAAAAGAQPENLPFARVLATTVGAKEASLHERALALQVLRYTGLTAVMPVKDVAALLKMESAVKHTSGDSTAVEHTNSSPSPPPAPGPSSNEWEVATLALACLAYVNTVIAGQLTKATHAATDTASSSADSRTPLGRQHLTPLTPPSVGTATTGASPLLAARCKVLTSHTDTIDQLLRHIQAIMEQCRSAYERESREVDYEDVSEWLARHDGGVSGEDADGLSASVVLPRQRIGLWRSSSGSATNITNTLGGGGDGGSLVRFATPTALATAASRVGDVLFSPLLTLSTGQTASLLPYYRLTPIGPPATRFFRGTGDDGRLNTLAALLDTSADVAAAAEQLLWLSGVDTNAAGLFHKRTESLLDSALKAVAVSRPNSPLLAPLLTRHVQHALRLARAATGILESSLVGDGMEVDVSPSIQRGLLQLTRFAKVNRLHTALFVDAVPIVTAFPLASLAEQAAVEELMRDVQAMLHQQLTAPALDDDALYVFDTVVEGCSRYFGRQRSGGAGVDSVLILRLLPTLLRYASLLSQCIHPTQPACANAFRFAAVLECMSCVVAHVGGQMAVLGFMSEDTLLALTRALGQFGLSSTYDHAAQRYHRLGWHVCWCALLSLWGVVTSLRGPYAAKASGWVPSLVSTLESTPRFASAVGAFPGIHTADREALLVWEVEEVDVATRLAAVLAIQGVVLSSLVSSVQAGFLFLQQPRLPQRCVASLPTADTSASEGRRVAAAQARALRNALTVLLKQPYYAFSGDGGTTPAAFVFAPELLSDPALKLTSSAFGGASAERGGASAKPLVFSLELLRQFTVRELQLLRRLTASGAAVQERSPDVSRTSTGSAASRESSAGRSPGRGPLADGETVTETEDLCTTDGVVEDAADQQAMHLETVQLALNAYVLTVEELLRHAAYAPGGFYTAAVMQGIRHTTERLLHTLRSLAREVRDLRRPLLSQIAQAKTAQLQAVLEHL